MERERTEHILELLTEGNDQSNEPQTEQRPVQGVVRGMISEVNQATGTIHVVVPRLSLLEPMAARSIVPIESSDVGREVIVAFEAGEPRAPFILGLLHQQGQNPPTPAKQFEAKVDGEQVVIEGKKEVVLKCGKASITLTRAGKVLIRGAYLLSRSSGVNRIKGGSVQLN
jgi:hypothetical protein